MTCSAGDHQKELILVPNEPRANNPTTGRRYSQTYHCQTLRQKVSNIIQHRKDVHERRGFSRHCSNSIGKENKVVFGSVLVCMSSFRIPPNHRFHLQYFQELKPLEPPKDDCYRDLHLSIW